VLLLLCIGVLLVGLTFNAYGDSYDVTATILAPLPGAPATITSPSDQTHFTATPITVTGTCPQNTYVKLNRNNVFSGSAVCGVGQTTYQIQTDLSLGSNVLVPQVYNVTDQAGPASSPITVWYDNPPQPTAPVPASPPEVLQVTSQDDVSFQPGVITPVSPYVTERGVAPPYSHIVVTFHSAPLTCETDADGNGNWSCTLDQALPSGVHTAYVVATTPQGQVLNFPAFHIYVSSSVAPLQQINPAATPFLIISDYKYHPRVSGQAFSLDFSLSGGVSPYAVTVLWGDGKESTIVRNDAGKFSAGHTYLSNKSQQTYRVKIEAVDNKGASAFLEISELVRGSGGIPIIGDISNTGLIWLAWPTYLVVLLMVLCFWLGERQEDYNLFSRKGARRRHA